MPLFEFRCSRCGWKGERLLARWSDSNPTCCGAETERLPPLINVIFTGVLAARYNDKKGDNPYKEGHWAHRVKSTRNLDGSPEPCFIDTFDKQRAFCKAEGLANPSEVGIEPPRSRKQVGVTPLKGVETRVPDQRELAKLRAQI